MKEDQILITDDGAAEYRTNIEGWVDRHGRFCGGDEQAARWSGCTHIICPQCGEPTPKMWTRCLACREKGKVEQYRKRKTIKWDEKTPLYSDSVDEYFWNPDDLQNHIEDHGCSIDSLLLIVCVPIFLRQIGEDYFEDELAEEGILPDAVSKVLSELNEAISEQGPVAWTPGKYAAEIDKLF